MAISTERNIQEKYAYNIVHYCFILSQHEIDHIFLCADNSSNWAMSHRLRSQGSLQDPQFPKAPASWRCFPSAFGRVSNAPTTTGTTFTFTCQILRSFLARSWYFWIFFISFKFTLISPGTCSTVNKMTHILHLILDYNIYGRRRLCSI